MHARSWLARAGRPATIRAIAASLVLATTAAALDGCASATVTCTVRHHYAIVIFQNGVGNAGTRIVTSFWLVVRSADDSVQRRQVVARITLRAASGGNPPLMIKTYRVGHAVSCQVEDISAHR
jgi:hypothetical protein